MAHKNKPIGGWTTLILLLLFLTPVSVFAQTVEKRTWEIQFRTVEDSAIVVADFVRYGPLGRVEYEMIRSGTDHPTLYKVDSLLTVRTKAPPSIESSTDTLVLDVSEIRVEGLPFTVYDVKLATIYATRYLYSLEVGLLAEVFFHARAGNPRRYRLLSIEKNGDIQKVDWSAIEEALEQAPPRPALNLDSKN